MSKYTNDNTYDWCKGAIRFSGYQNANFSTTRLNYIWKHEYTHWAWIKTIENKVPRAVVLSGGARRRSWAQAPRRKYIGKYIKWTLWMKEKTCWQVDKMYWQTRRTCRDMMFFILKLIRINWTDRVRIIIDSPSYSNKVRGVFKK